MCHFARILVAHVEVNSRNFFAILAAGLIVVPCIGQEQIFQKAMAELRLEEDPISFEPGSVIKRCSEVLAERNKTTREAVVSALQNRATAYSRTGKNTEALADADDLCQIAPNDSESHRARANVLALLNRLDQAEASAKRAVELSPKSAPTHVSLAIVYFLKKKEKACLAELDEAIGLDSKYGPAYFVRSGATIQTDPEQSLESANKFLELSPAYAITDPAAPYRARGLSLFRLNRTKEALSNLLVARAFNPKSDSTTRDLALVYADLGKFNMAALYADQCIGLSPNDPIGYGLRGKYYARIGMLKDAIKAAEKQAQLAEDKPFLFVTVADVYCSVGKYKAAMKYYDKALEADPNDYFGRMGKARLLACCPEAALRNNLESKRLAGSAYYDKGIVKYQKWMAAIVLAEVAAVEGRYDSARRLATEAIELAGPDFGRRWELDEKKRLFEKETPYRFPAKEAD